LRHGTYAVPPQGEPWQVHAERGLAAVRRAIEIHPGWRDLLERLSPDFAPAGERVRRELDSA
jgi:hypothetical protein